MRIVVSLIAVVFLLASSCTVTVTPDLPELIHTERTTITLYDEWDLIGYEFEFIQEEYDLRGVRSYELYVRIGNLDVDSDYLDYIIEGYVDSTGRLLYSNENDDLYLPMNHTTRRIYLSNTFSDSD